MTLLGGLGPAYAGEGWSDPEKLGHTARYADPAVAMSDDGAAVAVWSVRVARARSKVMVATRPAGGGWREPRRIAARGDGPLVAMTAGGSATVVWVVFDDHGTRLRGRTMSPAGRWGRIVDVAAAQRLDGYMDLAVDDRGIATLVWWKHARGAKSRIKAVRQTRSGSWGAPVNLTPPSSELGLPRVDVNAAGRTTVAFSGTFRRGARRVFVVQRRHGRWSPPQPVSGRGYASTVDVAVDDTGTSYVVWGRSPQSSDDFVEAARGRPTAHWGEPRRLSPEGETALDPTVDTDTHGNVVVAWRAVDATDHYRTAAAFRPAGEGWRPRELVSADGTNAVEQHVVIDDTGTATVAWQQARGYWDALNGAAIHAATGDITSGWTASTRLSRRGVSGRDIALAVAATGDTVATWARADDTRWVEAVARLP